MKAPVTHASVRDRIGPNAAIQLAAALGETQGAAAARDVFGLAGLLRWLDQPPTDMIDQTDAAHLHAAVRTVMQGAAAQDVLAEAGRRTGDYILAHRIPKPAQALLRLLPRPLALPLLLKAVGAHAWTFAGSGKFEVHGSTLLIRANPLAADCAASRPQCVWHAHVFETLIQALADPQASVRERACCAMGAPACVFEIRRTGCAPGLSRAKS